MEKKANKLMVKSLEYQRRAYTCQDNEHWLESFFWLSGALDVNSSGYNDKSLDTISRETFYSITPGIKQRLDSVTNRIEEIYKVRDLGLEEYRQCKHSTALPDVALHSGVQPALVMVATAYVMQASVAIKNSLHLMAYYCHNRAMDAYLAVTHMLKGENQQQAVIIREKMHECWNIQNEIGNSLLPSLLLSTVGKYEDESVSSSDSDTEEFSEKPNQNCSSAPGKRTKEGTSSTAETVNEIVTGLTGNAASDKDDDENVLQKYAKQFERKIINKLQLEKLDWSDAVGLEYVKFFIQANMVVRDRFPLQFESQSTLNNNVLLYGPPGTGKTRIAKIIASEVSANFLPVNPSDIRAKFVGEAEKKMKVLWQTARKYKPCVVFIDECEAILCSREDANKASDGVLSEFLSQAEGVDPTMDNSSVYLLAATNLPWQIDTAILRRFPTRIMVGLPGEDTRKKVVEYHFSKFKRLGHSIDEEGFKQIARGTKFYSNADLAALVNAISLDRWIDAVKATHFIVGQVEDKNAIPLPWNDGEKIPLGFCNMKRQISPCKPDTPNATEMTLFDVNDYELSLPVISLGDAMRCVRSLPPTLSSQVHEDESESEESNDEDTDDTEMRNLKPNSEGQRNMTQEAKQQKTAQHGTEGKKIIANKGAEELKKYFDFYKVHGTKFEQIDTQLVELKLEQKVYKKAELKAKSLPFFVKKAKRKLKEEEELEKIRGNQYDMLARFLQYEASSLLEQFVQIEEHGITMERVEVDPEKVLQLLMKASRKLATITTRCKRCIKVFTQYFPGHSPTTGSEEEINEFFQQSIGIFSQEADPRSKRSTVTMVMPKGFLKRRQCDALKIICGKFLNIASQCKDCRKRFEDDYPGQTLQNNIRLKGVNPLIAALYRN